MKSYYKALTAILIILQIPVLNAQDVFNSGTAGFTFLKIPSSARNIGLGETGITLTDAGPEALTLNPALLALDDSKISFNASYGEWYVETTHQSAALTYNLGTIGHIGAQFIYFDFGEIQKTRNPQPSESGSFINLGTYSAGGYVFGITFSRMLTDQFSFGASVKYVQEDIDIYSANNVIADIGFFYFTGYHSLRIAAVLQNFGLDAKYVDQKFKMPQSLKLGLAGELWNSMSDDHYLTLMVEANNSNDVSEFIQTGLEQTLFKTLILRAGYKFNYNFENLSFGAGLRFDYKGKKVRFDTGYMEHEYLEGITRFTLVMEL